MKILYVAKIGHSLTGVKKKIDDTAVTWKELGAQVYLYNELDKERLSACASPIGVTMRKVFNYFFDVNLHKLINEFNPDVIYWRFGPVPIFQFLPKNIKVIVESNTNLNVEKTTRNIFRQIAINIYAFKFNRIATGVIGVTQECLSGFRKIPKKLVVGNGYSFDQKVFSSSAAMKLSSSIVNAVFLGSPGCEWHGLDKIIDIADDNLEIQFTVVGYSEYNDKNIELPNNISFKGYLTGKNLELELSKASFAIGSLAMERAGMSFSSSLKNRTYLQYALPIIMQGRDTDLFDCPGVISLPMAFTKVDMKKAIHQITEFSFLEEDGIQIDKRIGSHSIEKKRLKFFQSLFG